MNDIVLLGAGASKDAGIPAAYDMTQRLVESFQELDAIVKGTDTSGQKAYFLDDPPTAIFVTAYNKAGLTNAMLGEHCSACDDGRLWIHAAALGEDAHPLLHRR